MKLHLWTMKQMDEISMRFVNTMESFELDKKRKKRTRCDVG
jgi:hypothetical protein